MVADESRIVFDATAEPEFDSGRWVDYWWPVREVIYFKRGVYARALQELGERAFKDGPPPHPDWWTEELLHGHEPSRRRADVSARSAGIQQRRDDVAVDDDPIGQEGPQEGHGP